MNICFIIYSTPSLSNINFNECIRSFLCDISMNKKRNIKEIVERKTITMKIYQNIVYLYIIIIM